MNWRLAMLAVFPSLWTQGWRCARLAIQHLALVPTHLLSLTSCTKGSEQNGRCSVSSCDGEPCCSPINPSTEQRPEQR